MKVFGDPVLKSKEDTSDGPRCYLHSCGRSRASFVGREGYIDPVGTRVREVHSGGQTSIGQGRDRGSDIS